MPGRLRRPGDAIRSGASLLALLPLACTPAPPSDATLYTQAAALGPQAALPLCMQILDPSLRGECRVGVATAMGRDGVAICEQSAHGLWRDDCFFQVSESIGATGEEALRLCKEARRFRPHCTGHALGRAACAEPIPLGEEDAALRRLQTLVRAYRPQTRRAAGQQLARELLAKCIAERWEETPDPAQCGAASEAVCLAAGRTFINHHPDPTALCSGGSDWLQAACQPKKAP